MTETQLVNAIQQALLADGYLVIRINSGAITMRNKESEIGRYVRFVSWSSPEIYKSIAGAADILAFNQNNRLAIEAKLPTKKPTAKQQLFLTEWEKAGGTSLVVTNITQLEPYLTRLHFQ